MPHGPMLTYVAQRRNQDSYKKIVPSSSIHEVLKQEGYKAEDAYKQGEFINWITTRRLFEFENVDKSIQHGIANLYKIFSNQHKHLVSYNAIDINYVYTLLAEKPERQRPDFFIVCNIKNVDLNPLLNDFAFVLRWHFIHVEIEPDKLAWLHSEKNLSISAINVKANNTVDITFSKNATLPILDIDTPQLNALQISWLSSVENIRYITLKQFNNLKMIDTLLSFYPLSVIQLQNNIDLKDDEYISVVHLLLEKFQMITLSALPNEQIRNLFELFITFLTPALGLKADLMLNLYQACFTIMTSLRLEIVDIEILTSRIELLAQPYQASEFCHLYNFIKCFNQLEIFHMLFELSSKINLSTVDDIVSDFLKLYIQLQILHINTLESLDARFEKLNNIALQLTDNNKEMDLFLIYYEGILNTAVVLINQFTKENETKWSKVQKEKFTLREESMLTLLKKIPPEASLCFQQADGYITNIYQQKIFRIIAENKNCAINELKNKLIFKPLALFLQNTTKATCIVDLYEAIVSFLANSFINKTVNINFAPKLIALRNNLKILLEEHPKTTELKIFG